MPYGSRGHLQHVLSGGTSGSIGSKPGLQTRPETPVQPKPERVELPRPVTPARTPRVEAPTRVSVIQRVPPAKSTRREDASVEVPRTQEPEQVSPRG